MLTEVFTAIENKFTAGNPFNTAIGGRMENDRAPKFSTFPYAIYFDVTNVPDRTFNYKRERMMVQFSIFDRPANNDPATLYNLAGLLDALYNDCSLAISGYNFVGMQRTDGPRALRDPEAEDIWICHQTYEILFHNLIL